MHRFSYAWNIGEKKGEFTRIKLMKFKKYPYVGDIILHYYMQSVNRVYELIIFYFCTALYFEISLLCFYIYE